MSRKRLQARNIICFDATGYKHFQPGLFSYHVEMLSFPQSGKPLDHDFCIHPLISLLSTNFLLNIKDRPCLEHEDRPS